MNSDTIFAFATPAGKSGVAVLRISGSATIEVLKSLKIQLPIEPRKALLRTLFDPITNSKIDEALVLWFPGPHSFTGEDSAELHTHGSLAIRRHLTKVLSSIVRIAEPGEFAKRSFKNGKMDLTQAEGLEDLINAESFMQQQQALRQMEGNLKTLYDGFRSQLIYIMAYIEGLIDFPEEDLPRNMVTEINSSVNGLIADITKHLDDSGRGERLRSGFYITIAGAPNVGKSSLLNYIANSEVAIVSDVAGTTRDIVETHVELNGYPIIFADTAGIRESTDPIEREGVRRANLRAQHADLKLLLFDISNWQAEIAMVIELVDANSLIIANKIDRLSDVDWQINTLSTYINDTTGKKFDITAISVAHNMGMDKLMSLIKETVACNIGSSSDPVITRERYRQQLGMTLNYLRGFNWDKPVELAAQDLYAAAFELGKITGAVAVDDILDKLFSSFCIGK